MNEFFFSHQWQITYTVAVILFLLIFQFILKKAAQRASKRSEIQITRTRLMFKYINILILLIASFLLALAWGIGLEDLSLIFSSVFAVLGVALFATWSILSNITAGVILFFSFPYNIGDKIKINDTDFPIEAVIEDIKAFHLHLRTAEDKLVTYPNNLILQKSVSLLEKRHFSDEGKEAL